MAPSLSEGATLGNVTKSGNNFSYPVTVADSVKSIVITFANSLTKNARLDDIKFYQGVAKKAAGLSWGTASRDVTIGVDDNQFPTLTNPNNLTVSFTSDNTAAATVDSVGTIKLITNISICYAML